MKAEQREQKNAIWRRDNLNGAKEEQNKAEQYLKEKNILKIYCKTTPNRKP
jgi:hypothetical protein